MGQEPHYCEPPGLAAAGLAAPTIFEFPHYAASEADYTAVKGLFTNAYDRRLYFPRNSAGRPDYTRPTGQFFPYDVVDVYGTRIIPENMGNYEPEAFNQHPAVLIPNSSPAHVPASWSGTASPATSTTRIWGWLRCGSSSRA